MLVGNWQGEIVNEKCEGKREKRYAVNNEKKRFVRYKEGAEMYSMCQSKFEQLAKDAKAIYKVNKLVLVNCDLFEKYLETFRME